MKKIISFVMTLLICVSMLTTTTNADYNLEAKLSDAGWSGEKCSITIVIKQPIKDTRNAVSEHPDTEVGHAFIRLEKKTSNNVGSYVTYFGFYPKDGVVKKNVKNSKSQNGKVYLSDFSHDWDIARTFLITEAKADEVLEWVNSYSKKYNIETNNCTTFAINALIKAGISKKSISITEHTWTIPDSWKNQIPSFLSWFGYTPGDAGEDIKGKTNVFIND